MSVLHARAARESCVTFQIIYEHSYGLALVPRELTLRVMLSELANNPSSPAFGRKSGAHYGALVLAANPHRARSTRFYSPLAAGARPSGPDAAGNTANCRKEALWTCCVFQSSAPPAPPSAPPGLCAAHGPAGARRGARRPGGAEGGAGGALD